MPVAGTKKYKVRTGTQPDVTVSIHFSQNGEKFYARVSNEDYVKLSDQERKDLGIQAFGGRYVVIADKFSEAFEKYKKVLDAVNDTVDGIESIPMIFVKFSARSMEATELRYTKEGERARRDLIVGKQSFFSSDMIEMKLDFYRVWHIKSNKREGVIDKPLEDCKPEHLRYALNNGFRGDGLGSDGKTFYLPWEQRTWDALVELHGRMTQLLTNLDALLSGSSLAEKLVQASKSGKMLNQ